LVFFFCASCLFWHPPMKSFIPIEYLSGGSNQPKENHGRFLKKNLNIQPSYFKHTFCTLKMRQKQIFRLIVKASHQSSNHED
jgi:hypothetical protein